MALLLASGRFPPKIAELLGVGPVLESRTDGALEEEAARPNRRWSPALLVMSACGARAPFRGLPTRAPFVALLLVALLGFGGCTAVPALVQCRMAEAKLRDVE